MSLGCSYLVVCMKPGRGISQCSFTLIFWQVLHMCNKTGDGLFPFTLLYGRLIFCLDRYSVNHTEAGKDMFLSLSFFFLVEV